MSEIVCVICKKEKGSNNYIQPRQIEVEAINRASIERDDKSNVVFGDSLHVNCRKITSTYSILQKLIKSKTNLMQTCKKPEVHNHSQPQLFNFKRKYLFSRNEVTTQEKLTKGSIASPIKI